jgi:hypothetical protein
LTLVSASLVGLVGYAAGMISGATAMLFGPSPAA